MTEENEKGTIDFGLINGMRNGNIMDNNNMEIINLLRRKILSEDNVKRAKISKRAF